MKAAPLAAGNAGVSEDVAKYAKNILQNKALSLLQKLETENDLGQIRNILELIEMCRDIEATRF